MDMRLLIYVRSNGAVSDHYDLGQKCRITLGTSVYNLSPKGIMRSAVPLPCFFEVTKSQKVAGQRPQQGTKSCRMGRNSVHPPIHPSVRCPSKGSESHLVGSDVLPERFKALPEGAEALPEGSEDMPERSEALTEGSKGL